MYILERQNFVREKIREAYPCASKFVFEHLISGYFRVTIEVNNKTVNLLADSNDSVKSILAKLAKNLEKSYNFFAELDYLCEGIPAKESVHQAVDIKSTLANFKGLNSLFSAEEVEKSNLEIKMIRANRVWLHDNEKILFNTAQNNKFHELANKVRSNPPKDIESAILEAYNNAMQE